MRRPTPRARIALAVAGALLLRDAAGEIEPITAGDMQAV